MKSNAGQPLDPLGIGIFGHRLGPFPDPAEFVQPAPHGLRGHRAALLGGQLRGQRRATPVRPAPAIGAAEAP